MTINKELAFWENLLKIPRSQFLKPYIKASTKLGLNHKGRFEHGTCNVIFGDAKLYKKVLMGIKAIRDHYLRL